MLMLAAIAIIFGLAVSGTSLVIAFHENPQGEYFDTVTGAIDFTNVVPLLLVNFLAAVLMAFVVVGVLSVVISVVRRTYGLR